MSFNVLNNDHCPAVALCDCPRPRSFGVLLFFLGRFPQPLLAAAIGRRFLVLVPGAARAPQRVLRASFTIMKFIMCLIVPEVKAVSCGPPLWCKLLIFKSNRLCFTGAPAVPDRAGKAAGKVDDTAVSRHADFTNGELILHDMAKLWRTKIMRRLQKFQSEI